MLTVSPPFLLASSVVMTALAQILLKKASFTEIKTASWFLFMGLSAGSYALSFVLYSQMLRYYALNKVYPATTVAQIILITLFGLTIGETINLRHALGLACGVLAVYLILS
jgi:drug/metabolite transporter (DMT)-like permease